MSTEICSHGLFKCSNVQISNIIANGAEMYNQCVYQFIPLGTFEQTTLTDFRWEIDRNWLRYLYCISYTYHKGILYIYSETKNLYTNISAEDYIYVYYDVILWIYIDRILYLKLNLTILSKAIRDLWKDKQNKHLLLKVT